MFDLVIRDGKVVDGSGGEPLAWAVKALSRDTAKTVGLLDRGLLAPGYKADLNVIDFDRLRLHPPEVARELPGRLVRGPQELKA